LSSDKTPAIAAANLTKTFGAQYALRGISLQVAQREVTAIFGPNGAGKTTFLRILAGLSRPSSGEVLIDGKPLNENPEAARQQLGVIAHQSFLYGELTAAENLFFYGRLYGLANLSEHVEQALRDVGLWEHAGQRAATFSRGMQQRLAIARAMIHRPSLLFLDEPFTGLDQHAAAMLAGWLKRLRSEERTILLVTHDLEQGLSLSDRIIIFVRGRIAFDQRTANMSADQFRRAYFEHVAAGQGAER
jgi:heme exporter protein A